MNKIIFVLFLICCVTDINCSGATDLNGIGKAAADENNINEAVAGNSNFAFDLYNKLRNDPNTTKPKGDLFFSPYSISTALAMTYAGARGETEKQMAVALHFTLPNKNLHHAIGTLQKQLVQDDKSRGYQIFLANALWGQKDKPVLKEFLNLTEDYYRADFSQLDFKNETEKSRQIINHWVEENTKEKIKDLIPPGGVDSATVLVLTNAIYFKGEWKNIFEKRYTRHKDFTVSATEKVKVDMMNITERFKGYQDKKLQIVELPYKGDELSMVVLLPWEIEGIKELEKTLTAESLNTLLSKMKIGQIEIYLPKFKINWGTFPLKKVLVELGMRDAFDEGEKMADFSGIDGTGKIWIKNVFHKAFIEVNEEGTEAAAGTGGVITSGLYMDFRADHPFIFIIKDNRTGSILFMGRVMNPAE
jgi:serine protease inhibitor